MAEIEAFSLNRVLLAPRSATQSTTYKDSVASNCIDGSKNDAEPNVCHTGGGANNWIRVDFAEDVDIRQVVITNRDGTLGNGARIVGASISISKDRESKDVVWTHTFTQNLVTYTFWTFTCNVGQRLDVASADCVACDSESYQDEADHQNTECKQQPKCTQGYVLGSPSTDSLDTRHAILECTACPENAYMSQDNHANRACTVQPSCSKGQYITPDSSIAERECKQCAVASFQSKETHRESNCNPQPFCKEGERLAAGESLSVKGSCVACGAGEYRKETRHQLATCEKCGPLECPTGQHLTGECERTQGDSLQCTNCAQHTYGDTVQVAVVGATRTIPNKAMYPCKPCDIACPAGTYPKYDETGACAQLQQRNATANNAMCADQTCVPRWPG